MHAQGGFASIVAILFIVGALLLGGGAVYVGTHVEEEEIDTEIGFTQGMRIPEFEGEPEMIVQDNSDTNQPLIDTQKVEAGAKATKVIEEVPETVAPTPAPTLVNTEAEEGLKLFTALEREIDVLIADGLSIGSEHYLRITSDIDSLVGIINNIDLDRIQLKLMSIRSTGSEGEPPPPTTSCTSNPTPVFTKDITDVSRISKITPPGTIFDNGVVKSHSYLWIKDGKKVPFYAPVDISLESGAYYEEGMGPQYLLFFAVSCEVGIKFDHILNPIDAITDVLPERPAQNDSRTTRPTATVSFKAGDLLGYTSGTSGAHNWDFGVYNTTLFPNPVTDGVENLEEIDKRADCGYDYFTASKRKAYKNLFEISIGGSSDSIPYCD